MIQIDMKMPSRCYDCPFAKNKKTNDYGSFCECVALGNHETINLLEHSRHSNCPLIEQEPCEDCISRQAVMEQINCWIGSGEYRYTNATDYLTRRMQGISPVTPEPKIGHWTEVEDLSSVTSQEPTTEDDLEVDAVNRKELLKIYEGRFLELQKLKHLKDNEGAKDRQLGVNYCINILKEMPSVTQQPKIGEWIDDNCSACGYGVDPWNNTPYCPNCGTKMKEVQG